MKRQGILYALFERLSDMISLEFQGYRSNQSWINPANILGRSTQI